MDRLIPGIPLVVFSESPSHPEGTVFEDDGETGYFYAVQPPDHKIYDGVSIYNVEAVVDRDRESWVEIMWSNDGFKSALFINDYPHAVFDFSSRRGYCRSNFPNFSTSNEGWRRDAHCWDDAVMVNF